MFLHAEMIDLIKKPVNILYKKDLAELKGVKYVVGRCLVPVVCTYSVMVEDMKIALHLYGKQTARKNVRNQK